MKNERAKWMRGNFGVMSHWLYQPVDTPFIAGDPEELAANWNDRVDKFDVERLAEQLAAVGAKWFIMTVGQNSGYYCAPNPVYDELVGNAISTCSRRDLFADIAIALKGRGIKTIAYIPSGAPDTNIQACERLNWENGHYLDEKGLVVYRENHRLEIFQRKWERVVAAWAERWGELCAGWWVDGVYFADQMYRFDAEPNFHSFAAALRSGNADAALCFCTGIIRADHLEPTCDEEDYSAGESGSYLYTPFDRYWSWDDIRSGKVGHTQFHVLNYLGINWGQGESPRYPNELAAAWTKYILSGGGSVTWDVPTTATGEIPKAFFDALSMV